MLGLDRLFAERPDLVRGRRVGLATNQATRDESGKTCLARFVEAGVTVTKLFAPEHGYDLAHHEGARFPAGLHPEYGVPIIPFYGEGMKLGPESIEGIDVIVYDMPNVGLRCHTYLANLVEAVRLSSEEQFPLIILDRPNALGGLIVEGPLARPELMSDVAPIALPFRHGLTAAEICGWLERDEGLLPDVTIVEMSGWRREMWHDATGLPWHAPSPNLATFEAMLAYPATVWLEGTNLSEGRGGEKPFETFGAPWIEPETLEAQLRGDWGVAWTAAEFTPTRSKHADERCRGLRLSVVDRDRYRPLAVGFELIAAVRRLWPDRFEWIANPHTGTHLIDSWEPTRFAAPSTETNR